MINLLPQQDKDRLSAERKRRAAIIIYSLLVFFIICLVFIFNVLRIYIDTQILSKQALLIESEKQFLQSETQGMQDKIKLANSSFSQLDIFYQRKVYFSQILEKISNILPKNCRLFNISINFDVKEKKEELEDGTEKIEAERKILGSLSGFAPLREDLLNFKEGLEKEEYFKNVSFPASNWISKENINFFINFEAEI